MRSQRGGGGADDWDQPPAMMPQYAPPAEEHAGVEVMKKLLASDALYGMEPKKKRTDCWPWARPIR